MLARHLRQFLLLALVIGNAFAQAPAFRLPDSVAPMRYEVRLAIDPREAGFAGEVTIAASVKRATQVIWLNATAIEIERAEARQGGREVKVEVVAGGADFVGLRGSFDAGDLRLRIAYRGKLDALIVEGIFRQQERGDWYVLTQFQAIGARRAFPCFDEPQWKTPWQLTIDAPASEVVVSNTPEIGAAPVEGRSGWTRHRFAESRPLPSYLVALAVGPWDVVDGGVAGKKRTPLRYLTPKGRGAEARYAKQITPRILELLEDYFGTPYPFEKLDSITIPQLVTFGAMENVGLITYGSHLMLARAHEETAHFREVYAGLAAHEIAHMWFGNLVTLKWWDDTWLNEAFASWIGTKVTYAFEPGWNTGGYRIQTRAAALEADRLASARRIRNPVEAKNQIDDAFDDITYSKGEEVLAMFEGWLGAERFKSGVRAFLARHAWGSAGAEDFFRALGEAAGGDSQRVVAALRGFVDQPGAPLIEAIVDCTGASPSVVVEQRRFRPEGTMAPELSWTAPVCFRYEAGGKSLTHCSPVDAWTRRIALPGATSCPAWLVGNVDGAGHYVTRYWPPQLRRIAERAAGVPSLEMQALASDTLLMARSGMLPIADALMVADAALGHPAPMAQLMGVRMLEELPDAWLKPADLTNKARIVRERALPRARELGWTPRPGDSDDVRALRSELLRFVADRPEGAALRGEARALALRWIADARSVDATIAQAALNVAGRSADAAAYERLEAAALSVENQRERSYLLDALVRARDPGLRARALALALDKPGGRDRIDGRATLTLLSRALADPESRPAAFDYVRANVDALEAKMPKDTLSVLIERMGRLCSTPQRDTFGETFRSRAPRYMTGELRYAQAFESIDLCVSARRVPDRAPSAQR
jgi:alanyl aminopeptidase